MARRHRLIEEAIRRHGAAAFLLLFDRLEADVGDELRLDLRLEQLVEADPAALTLAGAEQ